ncbi:hypothetical protein V6N11_084128 [Hibiscus sabdariffa]|uniref:Uncharacterized protein n=1 Tax=Hibiscus sabdariffa TaxID=183260 RepID=A0ABR2QDY7_9ROSI
MQSETIASVIGVMQLEFLEVLGWCVIGWCRSPISNGVLAAGMKASTINESHMMHIMGNRGSVICVEEETLEPTSSEHGRVLIESSSLDRIEYTVDLKVLEDFFLVCVSEVELFLCGPRIGYVMREGRCDGISSE